MSEASKMIPTVLSKKMRNVRPTRAEAEGALRTLLLWAGDNPDREGLRDTPARVARAYEDWFSGYRVDRKSSCCAPSRKSKARTT